KQCATERRAARAPEAADGQEACKRDRLLVAQRLSRHHSPPEGSSLWDSGSPPEKVGLTTCSRRSCASHSSVLEPVLVREVALDAVDVVLGAGVVPAAREPGADAAPDRVVEAVGGDDLSDRLPPVEPGASVVEVAGQTPAQVGRVGFGVQ